MSPINSKEYRVYANFLSKLAIDLTKFYNSKLNKTFKISNKLKNKGYDPVTTSDKAFEKFIRTKIKKKFPLHQIIGEEYGFKKTTSDFTWVIDPIDGTRSYVIGNPTWSNLISLNFKSQPVVGLANFPILNKYYLNTSEKSAYVFKKGIKKKISVSKKIPFKKIKLAGAFYGSLSHKQKLKIPKITKLMQFPVTDALSYSHLCEGKIDVVLQCKNKIWDIHPLIPIIKASGGIVTTWENQSAINAGNILVSSNRTIHKKIIKLLKPALKK